MTRDQYLQRQEDSIPVSIRQAIGSATRRGDGAQAIVVGAGNPFKLSSARKILAKRFDISGSMLNKVEDYLYAALNNETRRRRLAEDGPFGEPERGWMSSWNKPRTMTDYD